MGGDDTLHALQHLDSALRLPRFRGAGAKAVDEGGDLRHPPHLPCLEGQLQRQFLRALLLELGVIAGIGMNGAILDVQHSADDGVQELAVVRDHQQRARKRREPFLQPDDGVEIQMVGRFVQQQEVGARTQRPGHAQPHAPASREFRDGAPMIGRLEAESVHDGGRPCPGPGSRRWPEGPRSLPPAPWPHRALSASSMAASTARNFRIAVQHEFNGGLRTGRDFLFDVADGEAGRPVDVAAIRSQLAANAANRLDLPVPLAPVIPTLSPRKTVKLACSNSGLRTAPQGEIPSR